MTYKEQHDLNRQSLVCYITLLILFLSTHVLSEEHPIAAVFLEIDLIKSNIERSRNVSGDEPGDVLPIFRKLLRHEQEIGDQLNLGLKRLENAASQELTTALADRIENQFQRLRALVSETEQRTGLIRTKRSHAKLEEKIEYEYELREHDELTSALLLELVNNVGLGEALAAESRELVGLLEDTIKERAKRQADRLEITHERVEATADRLARATNEQRATMETELVALEERKQRIVKGLGDTINILRARNLETKQYSSILAGITGELSPDLLDSHILVGIAENWVEVVRDSLAQNGPGWLFKTIVFILILIVAKLLSKLTGKLVGRAVRASPMNFSTLLQQFFTKLAANIVLGVGLLIALAQIGIHLGPVLAGLGVAGLIVGFALQDTLSNFASGLMILIYRPYDVGDVIEAGGVSGKVERMNLVSTTVQTFDNQKLLVPNNKIWGDVIRNVNAAPTRRVDLVFGIGYDDDVSKAEEILLNIVTNQELVLKDPEPVIRLHSLGESSVDFIVRPWVNADDYWAVYWHITRAVKEQFTASGISIPYPQQDVHLYQHSRVETAENPNDK